MYTHLVAGSEIDSLVVHRFISVCAVINSWAQLDKPFSYSTAAEEVLVHTTGKHSAHVKIQLYSIPMFVVQT